MPTNILRVGGRLQDHVLEVLLDDCIVRWKFLINWHYGETHINRHLIWIKGCTSDASLADLWRVNLGKAFSESPTFFLLCFFPGNRDSLSLSFFFPELWHSMQVALLTPPFKTPSRGCMSEVCACISLCHPECISHHILPENKESQSLLGVSAQRVPGEPWHWLTACCHLLPFWSTSKALSNDG